MVCTTSKGYVQEDRYVSRRLYKVPCMAEKSFWLEKSLHQTKRKIVYHRPLDGQFNGKTSNKLEKSEKAICLPIVSKTCFYSDTDVIELMVSMVQVPIRLKAVKGEISSFKKKSLELICVPSPKSISGQITQI